VFDVLIFYSDIRNITFSYSVYYKLGIFTVENNIKAV
jgi:hypothetical protein